jgi:hypothetical protein
MKNETEATDVRSSHRQCLRALSGFILLISAFLYLPGCNIFEAGGAAVYKVTGPPPVPAKYVPKADEPMLVLVENYEMPTAAYHDAEMLSRALNEHLKTKKVAPLVATEPLYDLRTAQPKAYREMSIAGIGRTLGAKQVMYVELQQATVDAPTGSQLLRGRAGARVRIVDVDTGLNRWPPDAAEGYPVQFETALPRNEDRVSETVTRQQMHAGLAEHIGRLFYKWKPLDTSPQDD